MVRSRLQLPTLNGKLVLAVAIVWIVWGSTFLGIRIMVETIPPLLGSGIRFLIGGAVLAAVVLRGSGRRAFTLTAEEWRGSAAMGVLLVAGGVGLFAIAEYHHLPSSLAALIASSEAVLMLGLRIVAGRERISPATAFGVGVGAVGAILLLLPGSRPEGIPIWAVLLAFGGAVTWALGTYVGARLKTAPNLLAGVSIQMLTGGVVLSAIGLIVGEGFDPAAISTASAAALAGLVVASVAVYVAYSWILRHASLTLASTQSYVNPVVAVVLGVLVVGETLGGLTVVGMAITLIAVALVLRAERRLAREHASIVVAEPGPAAPAPRPDGVRPTVAWSTTGALPVVERRATGTQPAVPPAT